jgi:hypothetical protein
MSEIYSKNSPYFSTDFNGSYLDVITFRNLPIQQDDVWFEITSQYEFRPDLLAYDLYQDPTLWWVFAVRNKDTIKDPIYDMYAGQAIYLPKMSTLKKYLGI